MVSPDEARRELARRELARRQQQPQDNTAPNAIGDVAASGASGFARGTMDLIGLPGSIANGINSAGQWALRKGYELATGEAPQPDTFFGGPSEETLSSLPFGGRNMLSGSVLKEGLADKTFGASDYQPKTTAGEYARTVGEFTPGALALGGASAPSLLRNAVAPALTSETAGQLTEGTAYEPYARIAGALLGGVAGNRIGNASVPKLPPASEIKASAGYDTLKAPMKAAQLNQGTFQDIVKGLWDEADDFGLTTKLKGEVRGILDDFTKRAESGGASLYDLEVLRRSLRNIGGDKLDDASQALSAKLIDNLDNSVESLSAANIAASGDAGKPILDVLKDARQTYRTGVKSQIIEKAIQNGTDAKSGVENGLRQEFNKLLKNERVMRGFSEAEQGAIRHAAKGDFKSLSLRWLGSFGLPVDQGRNFLGSVMGGGVGSAAGAALGLSGPVGAVALPLLGTAAKVGASRMAQNQAAIAEALVKAGPAASGQYAATISAAKQASREAIARALLQSIQAPGQAATAPSQPR